MTSGSIEYLENKECQILDDYQQLPSPSSSRLKAMNQSLFWGSYAIGLLSIRSVAKMNVLSKAFVRVIIDSLVLHTRSFCPLCVNVGKIPSLSIIPIWVHFLHSRFISMEQSVRCILLLPPPLVASIALSHPLMPARHSRCKDRHTPCLAC